MSIDKIINDLKNMGEGEAAAKLHFMRLGFNRPEGFTLENVIDIADLFSWGSSLEGPVYWNRIHEALLEYRRKRKRL